MPPALIGAGIAGVGSIASSILSNKRQQQDREAAMKMLDPNSYPVGDPMREFLSGKTYDTTNTGQSYGTSSSSGTYGGTSRTRSVQDSTTNPFLTAEYGPMGDLMRGIIESRLRSGSGLPAGYEQQGIRAINDTSAGVNTALADKLTSSGLLGGPAEAALIAGAENSRGRSLADFRSSLPQVSRSMQNEDLNMAQMLTNLFGKGTASHSTGTSTTDTSGWQNQLMESLGLNKSVQSGGVPPGLLARVQQPYYPQPQGVGEQLFSSIPQLAMFLYGTGAFGKGGSKSPSSGFPGFTSYAPMG